MEKRPRSLWKSREAECGCVGWPCRRGVHTAHQQTPLRPPLPTGISAYEGGTRTVAESAGTKKKPTSHPGPMTSHTNADTCLPHSTTACSHEAETPEEVGKGEAGAAEALAGNLGAAARRRDSECARLQSEFLGHFLRLR